MFLRFNSRTWLSRVGVIATGLAIWTLSPNFALAQGGAGFGGPGGRGGFQPGPGRGMQNWYQSAINASEINRMVEQLTLDDAQKQIVQSLLQNFRTTFDAAMEASQQQMRDKMQQLRDDQDWQSMMSTGITMSKQWRNQATTMEQSFLADVQGVLTKDQLEQWATYNRGLKRRTANLTSGRIGALSGETIDLAELVTELDVDDQTRTALDPILEAYGTALEPAIDNRGRLLDKATDLMAQGMQNVDPEEMENQFNTLMRTRTTIRDLNDQYLQMLQNALPPQAATDLGQMYREDAFGGIYRDTRADRYFTTVLELPSLTEAQRAALTTIDNDYYAKVSAINQQLADIQRKTEIQNQKRFIERMQQMANDGGFQRAMGGPGFQPSPEDEQRRDLYNRKNELVQNTLTAITAALSPEQQAQAPVPQERQRGWGNFTPGQDGQQFRDRRRQTDDPGTGRNGN